MGSWFNKKMLGQLEQAHYTIQYNKPLIKKMSMLKKNSLLIIIGGNTTE